MIGEARLSSDGDCTMHPWMVGALVLVRAIDCEGHRVSGILIHVPRVKVACPGGERAGGRNRVGDRIAVSPGNLATFRNCCASRDIVEALCAPDTFRDRDVYGTAPGVRT